MKLVICTKFQVNQMNCVESRRAGARLTPPLKASCNYFFWKASGVNVIDEEQLRDFKLVGLLNHLACSLALSLSVSISRDLSISPIRSLFIGWLTLIRN